MSYLTTTIGIAGSISIVPVSIYIGYASNSSENPNIEKNNSDTLTLKSEDLVQISDNEERKDENIVQIVTESNNVPVSVPVISVQPTPIITKPKTKANDLMSTALEGSVGKKFKEYLIETRDDVLWDKKLDMGEKFYKDKSNNKSLTQHFELKKSEQLTKELLQDKCKKAYVKKKGDIFNLNHQKIMNGGYGSTVYSLCGKERQMPDNWGTGVL